MANMTIKEAFERTQAYCGLGERLKSLEKPKEQPIRVLCYVKDGQARSHYFCPACGREWEEEGEHYSFSCVRCPGCGARTEPTTRGYARSGTFVKKKVLALEADDRYALLGVIPSFSYEYVPREGGEDDPFASIRGEWCISPDTRVNLVCFIKEKGFRKPNSTGTGLTMADIDLSGELLVEDGEAEKLAELIPDLVPGEGGPAACGDVLRILSEASKKAYGKPRPKARMTPRQRVAEALRDYEPSEITEEQLASACRNEAPAFVTDAYEGYRRMETLCPRCGKPFAFEDDGTAYRTQGTCPACGEDFDVYATPCSGKRTASENVIVFDLFEKTGWLIQRILCVEAVFDRDMSVTRTFKPQYCVVYADKSVTAFRHGGGSWIPATWIPATPASLDWCLSPGTRLQEDDEIAGIIARSVLKYSGLTAAWGLDGREPVLKPGRYEYASAWYKHPCLEKVVLAGLRTLALDLVCMSDAGFAACVADPDGRSVMDVLGINKPVLRAARELNLSYDKLRSFKALWELDNGFTAEQFAQIDRAGETSRVLEIARGYGIPVRKVLDYVQACHDYQCIKRNEALTIWRDYLNMASRLGYRLTDKEKRFPQSLKKEHDCASFAYEAVCAQDESEEFSRRAALNSRYEYSWGNLKIVVPQKPEDIVAEGNQQHHCVASYVDRVGNGSTAVLFIRRKDHPDDSYFTMEVKDGEIVQVKGFANKPPRERELLEFIGKFANAKNLRVRY